MLTHSTFKIVALTAGIATVSFIIPHHGHADVEIGTPNQQYVHYTNQTNNQKIKKNDGSTPTDPSPLQTPDPTPSASADPTASTTPSPSPSPSVSPDNSPIVTVTPTTIPSPSPKPTKTKVATTTVAGTTNSNTPSLQQPIIDGGTETAAATNYYPPLDSLSPEMTYILSFLSMGLGVAGAIMILKKNRIANTGWIPGIQRESLLNQ